MSNVQEQNQNSVLKVSRMSRSKLSVSLSKWEKINNSKNEVTLCGMWAIWECRISVRPFSFDSGPKPCWGTHLPLGDVGSTETLSERQFFMRTEATKPRQIQRWSNRHVRIILRPSQRGHSVTCMRCPAEQKLRFA